MNPDDMFTPGGLAVFLTSGETIGSGRWSNRPPRVPVHFGDHPRPVYVEADDLRCPECGGGHDPPRSAPAKYIAANKILNDGLCGSCDD